MTRLDALDAEGLAGALQSRVDWNLRQRIDRLAPVRIAVPSGMERRIEYALEADGTPRPPVLAVKLQELFGLAETPRIAEGRVPLLLHLLSPAGRPLQVTADLRSFWENTWPEVRREMKGRYPKHPWPEDPWSAPATAATATAGLRRTNLVAMRPPVLTAASAAPVSTHFSALSGTLSLSPPPTSPASRSARSGKEVSAFMAGILRG
jgi:hypothetical protein